MTPVHPISGALGMTGAVLVVFALGLAIYASESRSVTNDRRASRAALITVTVGATCIIAAGWVEALW